MRNSMRLGLLVALSATLAFVGCGDDEGGSGSGGKGGTAGSKGGRGGTSGTATGGTAGKSGSGGSTGGSAGTAGKAGTGGNAGTAGSAGKAGSAGSSGTAGGGQGGAAGNDGSAGSSGAGGADGSTDGTAQGGAAGVDGSAGASGTAGAGGAACVDDGGTTVADSGSVTTAIVLIDNVVLKNAANTTIVKQWQFDTAADIVDSASMPRPGDKWTRTPYPAVNLAAGAHDNWAPCDGNPAPGSFRNIIPFTAVDQYYEVSVPFAVADYASHHITARAKLVAGGRPLASCPARAEIFTIKVDADAGYPEVRSAPVALIAGGWYDLTLDIPANYNAIDQIGIRITTYACN